MSEAAPAAAVPGPASCLAETLGDYSLCEKCGLAWRTDAERPPCGAMSVGRLCDAVMREISYHLASHEVCVGLLKDGTPADPLASLKRAAELRGVLRTLDRCLRNPAILDILNPKRRQRGGE
jgi:hypothetical protein